MLIDITWMRRRCLSLGRVFRFGLVCALLPVFLTGCPNVTPPPTPPPPNGTPDPTPPSTTNSVQIRGYSGTVELAAAGPPVSILYSVTGVPQSASGFYVEVETLEGTATTDPQWVEKGNRIVIAPDLPLVGTDLQFRFDPGIAGTGFYQVGVVFTGNGVQQTSRSTGVIKVGLSPSPTFVQPDPRLGPVEISDGSPLFVSFDSGVAIGDIHWRLFYFPGDALPTGPPNDFGIEIATGTGTTGSAEMLTSDLAAGEYGLGVSVTDIGLTIAEAVAAGQSGRIVTNPISLESAQKVVILAP